MGVTTDWMSRRGADARLAAIILDAVADPDDTESLFALTSILRATRGHDPAGLARQLLSAAVRVGRCTLDAVADVDDDLVDRVLQGAAEHLALDVRTATMTTDSAVQERRSAEQEARDFVFSALDRVAALDRPLWEAEEYERAQINELLGMPAVTLTITEASDGTPAVSGLVGVYLGVVAAFEVATAAILEVAPWRTREEVTFNLRERLSSLLPD